MEKEIKALRLQINILRLFMFIGAAGGLVVFIYGDVTGAVNLKWLGGGMMFLPGIYIIVDLLMTSIFPR